MKRYLLTGLFVGILGFLGLLWSNAPSRMSPELNNTTSLLSYEVSGGSMEPLLKQGQTLTVDTRYYLSHPIVRGDVVVFSTSGNERPIVKSVRAVSGDRFDFRENHLFINGSILTNSTGDPYYLESPMLELMAKSYPVIPDRTVLLLGEIPSGSYDSSQFGLVDTKNIIGKVIP